jgi:hypothetical protein
MTDIIIVALHHVEHCITARIGHNRMLINVGKRIARNVLSAESCKFKREGKKNSSPRVALC